MRVVYVSLLVLGLATGAELDEDPHPPLRVRECLKNPKTTGLIVKWQTNPYYLRGNFDGDGRPDYALQVHSEKSRPDKWLNGVLVCSGNGSVFLLGSGIGGSQFSDMPDDNFLSIHWEVLTKNEVKEDIAPYDYNVPHPAPKVKWESIALNWEDGTSLIYWDGTKFRWAGSRNP